MIFDHDFGFSFPLFSSLLKKREEEWIAKIVVLSHAFLLDPYKVSNKISNLSLNQIFKSFSFLKLSLICFFGVKNFFFVKCFFLYICSIHFFVLFQWVRLKGCLVIHMEENSKLNSRWLPSRSYLLFVHLTGCSLRYEI